MNTHIWLSRLIAGLISVVQASSLRDRYYSALSRIETLEIAISDIERISASRVDSSQRHKLIAGICDRVKNSD
jgi:hypothetical protein